MDIRSLPLLAHHVVNKDQRVSLKWAKDGVYSVILFIYVRSSADSAAPAVISELEPSGGCSVWIKDWFCDSNQTLRSLLLIAACAPSSLVVHWCLNFRHELLTQLLTQDKLYRLHDEYLHLLCRRIFNCNFSTQLWAEDWLWQKGDAQRNEYLFPRRFYFQENCMRLITPHSWSKGIMYTHALTPFILVHLVFFRRDSG